MSCNAGTPVLVAAGATVNFQKSKIMGFLCTTSGTITISRLGDGGAATVLVNALAVTAGEWVDIPMIIGTGEGRIVSASAVGVLITG